MSRVRRQRSSLLAKPLANIVGFLIDESMYVLPFSRLGRTFYDFDTMSANVCCAIVSTRIMMAGTFYRSTSYSIARMLISELQVRGETIRISRTKTSTVEPSTDLPCDIRRYRCGDMADAWHIVGVVVESQGEIF
jgi:hypothetical protein